MNIEKIVLEVLENKAKVDENKWGVILEKLDPSDFPNVAKQVAEKIEEEMKKEPQ